MNRPRLVALTAGLFAVGVVIDLIIDYSPVPGYGAGIGLIGTFVLVYGAKAVIGPVVTRPEDRYPDDVPADVHEDLPPETDAQGRVTGDPTGTLPPATHQRDALAAGHAHADPTGDDDLPDDDDLTDHDDLPGHDGGQR
ncbi:MAG: hypothetical protein JJT89_18015 [Nitriliruptoraceae bacterium]|nr:hypothetical protein [Nitriliruptoraceae bacterium]